MRDGAPAPQDKPVTTPPMLDEVVDLARQLEPGWAAERAAFPPGTLLNDGLEAEEPEAGAEGGEPGGDPAATGQPPEGEESFYDDFDPSQIPEGTDPLEWVGKKYGEMRKAFTQKTQGISQTRREAEESQALIEGLRDPSTMPHYLRLLGVDLTNPEMLQQLGISGGGQGDPDEELLNLLDEEDSVESRVEKIERERQEEVQQRQSAEMDQALDDLADQELEKIEGAWGRELDDDEDAFIRHRAEATPGADGFPDYEKAATVLKGFLDRRIQEELERRSKPGRGAPGGRPGGKALDPNKEEDRVGLGAAAAERAMASQE